MHLLPRLLVIDISLPLLFHHLGLGSLVMTTTVTPLLAAIQINYICAANINRLSLSSPIVIGSSSRRLIVQGTAFILKTPRLG